MYKLLAALTISAFSVGAFAATPTATAAPLVPTATATTPAMAVKAAKKPRAKKMKKVAPKA